MIIAKRLVVFDIKVHHTTFERPELLDITSYQSPLVLTELFQRNLINVSYLACYLYQVMMTLHFLNDVANDAESTLKLKITP